MGLLADLELPDWSQLFWIQTLCEQQGVNKWICVQISMIMHVVLPLFAIVPHIQGKMVYK